MTNPLDAAAAQFSTASNRTLSVKSMQSRNFLHFPCACARYYSIKSGSVQEFYWVSVLLYVDFIISCILDDRIYQLLNVDSAFGAIQNSLKSCQFSRKLWLGFAVSDDQRE